MAWRSSTGRTSPSSRTRSATRRASTPPPLYGFTNTLLAILENRATHPPRRRLRHPRAHRAPPRFPAYKAQREAMPEELAAAIPRRQATLPPPSASPCSNSTASRPTTSSAPSPPAPKPPASRPSWSRRTRTSPSWSRPTTCIWKPGRKGADHEILDLAAVRDNGSRAPGAGHRRARPVGRRLRQHPRRPRHRRKNRQEADRRVRLDREPARPRRRAQGQAAREPRSPRRAGPALPSDLATIIRDAPLAVDLDDLALSPRDDDAVKAPVRRIRVPLARQTPVPAVPRPRRPRLPPADRRPPDPVRPGAPSACRAVPTHPLRTSAPSPTRRTPITWPTPRSSNPPAARPPSPAPAPLLLRHRDHLARPLRARAC